MAQQLPRVSLGHKEEVLWTQLSWWWLWTWVERDEARTESTPREL